MRALFSLLFVSLLLGSGLCVELELERAFTVDPARPPRGSIAGGTLLTIEGTGFNVDTPGDTDLSTFELQVEDLVYKV